MIEETVVALKKGGVVVFPTDTVYGLICDGRNKQAKERIFNIKKRSKRKPLSYFCPSIEFAKSVARITPKKEKEIKKFWPGNYTFIFPKKGGKGTIAVRVPDFLPLSKVMEKVPFLAQTSANISGENPGTSGEQIYKRFEKEKYKPDIVINMGVIKKEPSHIFDFTRDKMKKIR